MAGYLDYLGRKVPLGQKMACSCRLASLAEQLQSTGNLYTAVRRVYAEKTANEHKTIVAKLVHGLSQKIATKQPIANKALKPSKPT
jgi:hypothetical protein